jgi:hypothetical protein
MVPRSETDADIEFAMLTTHEDPPLPPRVEKGRACSDISEIKIGLVILLLGLPHSLRRCVCARLSRCWVSAGIMVLRCACK